MPFAPFILRDVAGVPYHMRRPSHTYLHTTACSDAIMDFKHLIRCTFDCRYAVLHQPAMCARLLWLFQELLGQAPIQ